MDAATIAALATGICSIIAAIFAGLTSLRNGRKLDGVQGMVNGNLQNEIARNAQLQSTLVGNGVPIPPRTAPASNDTAS